MVKKTKKSNPAQDSLDALDSIANALPDLFSIVAIIGLFVLYKQILKEQDILNSYIKKYGKFFGTIIYNFKRKIQRLKREIRQLNLRNRISHFLLYFKLGITYESDCEDY